MLIYFFINTMIKDGETEYRFYKNYKNPFPLYPNEKLTKKPEEFKVVKMNSALKLEALRDFIDE